MFNSCFQMNDLPNEIFMIIFKYLHHHHVLYSFFNINKRINSIIIHTIIEKKFTLISFDNSSCAFYDIILNRNCDILFKSFDNIQWFNLDSSIAQRILVSTKFTKLKTLVLYISSLEAAINLFADKSFLFKQPIEILMIKTKFILSKSNFLDLSVLDEIIEGPKIFTRLFKQCCTRFQNLTYLNFSSFINTQQLSFNPEDLISFSSNLCKLNVQVDSLNDCLFILDDHSNQINNLSVTICGNDRLPLNVHQNHNLINLKEFSITYVKPLLNYYENSLLLLLRRMINVEEICLEFLSLGNYFIDGNTLTEYFLNKLPRLNKFTCNIGSMLRLANQFIIPSNEDYKNTFKNFNDLMVSNVYHFSKMKVLYSHIYSYPYRWTCYQYITNDFSGGLFKCVHTISLYDECPFEHDFFLRISKSFPFIKKLILYNNEPQKNDDLQWPIIKYHRLIEIDLAKAHDDYVDKFLNNTKICLLNNLHLRVRYDSLEKTTNNFTRDATRMNCSKIITLTLLDNLGNSGENLKQYFPHAQIRS